MKNNIGLVLCLISVIGLGFTCKAQSSQKLFDGKSLQGWKVLAGKAEFSIQDGALVGTAVPNSGNTFLVTEKEFGDFILDLDVKMESPLGNSGIQVRSHFDSIRGKVFGRQCEIDPSSRKWSGGIYDEARREWLYPMDLHAQVKDIFKVGAYNHFHIECIGREMKTWINGTVMASLMDTLDNTGFIGLQVHAIASQEAAGKRVFFKNIIIQTSHLKPKPFPKEIFEVNYIPNSLSPGETLAGWKLLYDGISSEGWRGANLTTFPPKGWLFKDKTLHHLPSIGNEVSGGGDIITDKEYSAFDLSFEFKLTPGANSGVKYFVTLNEKTDGSAIGLEYQVLDDKLHPDAKLGRDGDRTLASLYDLIPANKPARFIRPIGSWNTGRIVVYPNNKVEHYLNGIKVLEYVRGSKEFLNLVERSKYKIWPNFGQASQGHILLQDHGNEVYFRSLKIKTL